MTATSEAKSSDRPRQLSEDELALQDKIKGTADALAVLFARVDDIVRGRPEGVRNTADVDGHDENVVLALRHLEDAVAQAMRALAA